MVNKHQDESYYMRQHKSDQNLEHEREQKDHEIGERKEKTKIVDEKVIRSSDVE